MTAGSKRMVIYCMLLIGVKGHAGMSPAKILVGGGASQKGSP